MKEEKWAREKRTHMKMNSKSAGLISWQPFWELEVIKVKSIAKQGFEYCTGPSTSSPKIYLLHQVDKNRLDKNSWISWLDKNS